MTAPVAVDPATGELLGQITFADVSNRIDALDKAISENTAEITRILAEQGRIQLMHDAVFDAAAETSGGSAADKRSAAGRKACRETKWAPGESLAEAMMRVKVQLKTAQASGHNMRSQMSGWQTISANLRAEANGLGYRP